MNKEIKVARKEKKKNCPVLKELNVPMSQRSKFVGVGGFNLKKIYSNTGKQWTIQLFSIISKNKIFDFNFSQSYKKGVSISPTDETNFSIFAPNANSLKEAEEMIEKLLKQPVCESQF